MRLHDEKLLESFRHGRCEVCGVMAPTCAHHTVARKNMGGGQIDHPRNLIAVCLNCHEEIHRGRIKLSTLVAIIARREKCTTDEVLSTIREIRRAT